jgi:hypothetical protein
MLLKPNKIFSVSLVINSSKFLVLLFMNYLKEICENLLTSALVKSFKTSLWFVFAGLVRLRWKEMMVFLVRMKVLMYLIFVYLLALVLK